MVKKILEMDGKKRKDGLNEVLAIDYKQRQQIRREKKLLLEF